MNESLLLKIALFWYGFMSLLLFMLYGLDKAQAVANGRRIPEKVLHFLALAGGFPGGFLGRSILPPQNKKTSVSCYFSVAVLYTYNHLVFYFESNYQSS